MQMAKLHFTANVYGPDNETMLLNVVVRIFGQYIHGSHNLSPRFFPLQAHKP